MKTTGGMTITIALVAALALTLTSHAEELAKEDGFLNATCTQAQDCYVLEGRGLALACWYNVKRCKCQNTIRSDFDLEWEDGKCLMSKYGPCGSKEPENPGLSVGCQDGFVCVENQCRDPKNPTAAATKPVPYGFPDSKCSDGGCQFSDDLRFQCDVATNKCVCKKPYIADGRSPIWDVRNYHKDYSCSVGKFGPCGTKNGMKIDCHGKGLSCVDGTCLDPNHPISELNESCQSTKNCKTGLICSRDRVCILPNSLPVGKSCNKEEECLEGLLCSRGPNASPWSSPFCRTAGEAEGQGPPPNPTE